MLKVGLLVGREGSFPDALIVEVNARNDGVLAEYINIGELSSATPIRTSSSKTGAPIFLRARRNRLNGTFG